MAEMAKARGAVSRWLVVMAREPRAGAVKTRLARDIGTIPATQFYRHALAHLLKRLACDRRWKTVLAVTPDSALMSPVWPRDVLLLPQGQGDLGVRLQRIFDDLPPGPVVFIGTDIPEIQPGHIAGAFRRLGSHDAVLGPATDGGYWLVGQRRSPRTRRIFSGVRWSGTHTLEDTLRNLGGASVAMLEPLEDADDKASHRRLSDAGGRVVSP